MRDLLGNWKFPTNSTHRGMVLYKFASLCSFRRFLLRRLGGIGTQLDTNPITYKSGTPDRKTGPMAGKRYPGRKTVPLAGKRYTWPENVTHGRKTFSRFREMFSWFPKNVAEFSTRYGYFPYFRKFKLLVDYLEISAHWPTGQGDITTWPGNVTSGRGAFSRFRKMLRDFRSAEDFATRVVISDISTNLSFLRISSKFRRIARLGRATFPSYRETLYKAVTRFPISENVFRFRETRQTLRPTWLFPICPQI